MSANSEPKIQWIPFDIGAWPDGLPKYDGDSVIDYPDGTKLDLNELDDPFSDSGQKEE